MRAPRLRWSDPGRKSRAGVSKGTTRVRDGRTKERPAIKRLGKVRGAILDALDAAGGTATLAELCELLHRSRPRDLRPRKDRPGPLLMLVESNIITIEDDRVTLAEDWRDALDDARKLAREIDDGREKGAATLIQERYARERAEYREHLERARKGETEHDPAPTEAEMDAARERREQGPDGYVEDLRPLSPLAVALDEYLRLNPHKVTEYSGWLASTLNVYGWTTDRVTRQEVAAAIEELGGNGYRRSIMELARTPEEPTARRVVPLRRPAPAPAPEPEPTVETMPMPPPAPEPEPMPAWWDHPIACSCEGCGTPILNYARPARSAPAGRPPSKPEPVEPVEDGLDQARAEGQVRWSE